MTLLSKAEIEGMMKRATKGSLDDHDKFHVFMDLAATCLSLYEKVEGLERLLANRICESCKGYRPTAFRVSKICECQ